MRGGKEIAATAARVGGLLLLCCLAGVAQAADGLPPIEISGALQSSVVSRQLPKDDDHEMVAQQLGYAYLSTYLWEPWLATLTADLNAAIETDFGDDDGNGDYGDTTFLDGELSLSALPLSRYPFTINYSVTDSRIEGDFSGSDYIRNRAGLSGRAVFTDQFSLNYSLSHDQIDRNNYGDLTSQRADASLRHTFNIGDLPLNITDIGLSVKYYNNDFQSTRTGEPDSSNQTGLGTIYYHASPTDQLDHDFRATVIADDSSNHEDSFDRLAVQGVTTVQWRSLSNDVTATGALRTLYETIDYSFGDEHPDSDNALISGNAGVAWRATDRLTFSLGARGTAEQIENFKDDRVGVQIDPAEENYGGAVLASASYRSLRHEFLGFDWSWDAHADSDVGYETEYGMRSDALVSVGHTFERPMTLPWIDTVNAAFYQEVELSHESEDDGFEPSVTHSASFTQGFADESGSSYLRLYIRDTHSFGEEFDEFQTVQVDFSRRMPIDKDQSLQGNLSVQAVRQLEDEEDDFFVTARADLAYEYRDVFGVRDLSFLSNLRINAIDLDDLTRDRKDDLNADFFRNDWRNRVQYRIGKLSVALEGTLYQEDEDLGHYARFTVRRVFDGLL